MEGAAVNDDTLGITVLAEGKSPIIVDIVFVHGLNGDPLETWMKDEVVWPRDLLPDAMPSARIMTYGYDANPITFFDNTSQNRIYEHSLNLLNELINERDAADERHRPMIFVGHSLGGLVIKDAICQAHDAQSDGNKPDVADIMKATFGVVFMGTPHRGSSHANFQTMMANFAKAVLRDEDERLIKALQTGSETTASLASRFTSFASRLQIRTCIEELGFGKVGKIVDDYSAVLNYPNESICTIHANHREMVRYQNAKDHNYKLAMGMIRQIKNRIPTSGPVNAADHINSSMLSADPRLLQSGDAVSWAITKSDYHLGPRGHLSFTEGETITNIIQLPGPFWQGQIDERVGMFPYTYVTLPKANRGAQNGPQEQARTSNTPVAENHDSSNRLPSPTSERGPDRYSKFAELDQVLDAVTCEEPSRLRRMLGLGFDVDWTGEARHELLLQAVDTKNPEIVTILLEKGAFAKKKEWDEALIERAILSQKSETVRLVLQLIDKEIVNDNFPFAASNGRLNIVQEFVNTGVSINVHSKLDGWTPLHHAAAQATTELTEYLISKGADVNSKDHNSRTPLHIAVQDLRYLDIIRCLVEAGANLSSQDRNLHTPLHLAVRYWNHKRSAPDYGQSMTGDVTALVSAMTYLIEKGSDVNTINRKGDMPLHNAVQYKSIALVELLIQQGASLDISGKDHMTPLEIAASFDKVRSVDLLLGAGAKTNTESPAGNCLHFAADKSATDAAERLIKAGAPINGLMTVTSLHPNPDSKSDPADQEKGEGNEPQPIQTRHPEWGITPLHFAARTGNTTLVKMLLEHGANVNQQAIAAFNPNDDLPNIGDGAYPLTIAAAGTSSEHLEVLQLLVEHGADLSAQDEMYGSALHWAATSAPDTTVQWLIETGAPVDSKNKDDVTPLAMAVLEDGNPSDNSDAYTNTINILLDAGANIDWNCPAAACLFGWQRHLSKLGGVSFSCLHLAVYRGYELKVKQLIGRGATIETSNSARETPLQTAATAGNVPIMRILLEGGAASSTEDWNAALKLAQDNNQHEAVELLKQIAARKVPIEASGEATIDAPSPGKPMPPQEVENSAEAAQSSASQGARPNQVPVNVDEYVQKSKKLAGRFKRGFKAFLE